MQTNSLELLENAKLPPDQARAMSRDCGLKWLGLQDRIPNGLAIRRRRELRPAFTTWYTSCTRIGYLGSSLSASFRLEPTAFMATPALPTN